MEPGSNLSPLHNTLRRKTETDLGWGILLELSCEMEPKFPAPGLYCFFRLMISLAAQKLFHQDSVSQSIYLGKNGGSVCCTWRMEYQLDAHLWSLIRFCPTWKGHRNSSSSPTGALGSWRSSDATTEQSTGEGQHPTAMHFETKLLQDLSHSLLKNFFFFCCSGPSLLM